VSLIAIPPTEPVRTTNPFVTDLQELMCDNHKQIRRATKYVLVLVVEHHHVSNGAIQVVHVVKGDRLSDASVKQVAVGPWGSGGTLNSKVPAKVSGYTWYGDDSPHLAVGALRFLLVGYVLWLWVMPNSGILCPPLCHQALTVNRQGWWKWSKFRSG